MKNCLAQLLPLFLLVQETFLAANFLHFTTIAPDKVAEVSFNGSTSADVDDAAAITADEKLEQTDVIEESNLETIFLENIETDIKDFEDLKKTIAFLEKHIIHHSDVHIVDSKELVEADVMLRGLDDKIIKPYELQLESFKSQIVKLNHKFDNETFEQIRTIVENVEMFLEISRERVEQVEILEQDWETAEETAKIQEMIDIDEKPTRKIMIEAMKPSVTDEIKKKLNAESKVVSNAWPYPTSKSGGAQVSLDQSTSEAKSMYKKMKQMKMLKNVESQQHVDTTPTTQPSISVVDVSNDLDQQKAIELAKVATLKKIKVNLEKEALNDMKGKNLHDDPVEHYSAEVEEALEAAKGYSHEFMDHQLHHQDALNNEKEGYLSSLHMFMIVVLALVVLIGIFVTFRMMSRKSRPRVSMQNLTGVGGAASCDKSYMELESVKEESGWGRSWSPWSGNKTKQHKFK